MTTQSLFGEDDEAPKKKRGASDRPVGKPRLRLVERSQLTLAPFDLDGLVPDDHRVRQVWAFVEALDLSPLLKQIRARGETPGRPATDPRLLLALWIYATYRKVASSHELARLCVEHNAFRWLCGGVSINQHTLSDFRSTNAKEFDRILIELLGALLHAKVLRIKRVAQDGMKVRASAGQSSFHRETSLEESLKIAAKRLKAAKKGLLDPKKNARKAAAQERAAREREERVKQAIAELPNVRARSEARRGKKKKKPEEARASTTDKDARVMRMGDGGYRPAFNVQLAADTETRLIVGVSVSNVGSDYSQFGPMLEDIERRTGEIPKEVLLDGGYVNHEAYDAASEGGSTVYSPPKGSVQDARDGTSISYERKPSDSDETAKWRKRMKTEKAKAIYKERAATIETVNADLKAHRGLDRVHVRGVDKVTSVFLLGVLGYNAMRLISLGALGALT